MDDIAKIFKLIKPAKLAVIGGISIFILGALIFIAAHFSKSDNMRSLYKDLNATDARSITSYLEEKKINYITKNNGSEILVSEKDLDRVRIDMASQQVPTLGSGAGYELFDTVDSLGSTNFIQNINYLRALEGELSKTIRSVDGIKNARVHLVLPKREMFSREEQIPKASVILALKTAKGFTTQQVESIRHLVAAAVPKLELKNISIIDSSGNLLTDDYEDNEHAISAKNEVRRLDYEKRLSNKIKSMVEKVVGLGGVQAQVSVDMNFNKIVTNEEIFNPDGQVLRSSQTTEEKANAKEGDSNTVSVGQNVPNESSNTSGTGGNFQENLKTEETVNYEISKKVINAVKTTGEINKISAAVIVDGFYQETETGEKKYVPRTPEQMESLSAIVKTAIGYSEDRGDKVEVVNIQFKNYEDEIKDAKEKTFLGWTKEEIMQLAEGLGVALVSILVIMLIIRPLVKKAFEPAPEEEEERISLLEQSKNLVSNSGLLDKQIDDDDEDDEEIDFDELIDISKVEGQVKASSVRKIGEIVDNHPEEALAIIRNWMYQEN